MIARIVECQNFVTILGASDPKPEDIDEALRLAPVLVAADGGAAFAVSEGHMPAAVIGDFDSIPRNVADAVPSERLHRIADQETNDFEKCLTSIAAPLCLAVGFTGKRVDHELAVFASLFRSDVPPCIVIGSEDVVFAAPRNLILELEPGTRVSLYALTPVTGRSDGLRWPIDDLTLDPMGRLGTSNEALGPVQIEFAKPGTLVILPREALEAAMHALAPDSALLQ